MILRSSRTGAFFASLVAVGALAACSSGPVYTRVASESLTASGSVFILQNREVSMTVRFPQGWRAMRMDRQPDGAVGDDLLVSTSPRGAFALAAAIPSFPDGTPDSPDWQYSVLDELRASLESKSPAEYTWVSAEWVTVTGGPTLQTTVVLKDGSRTRDTYFFHEGLFFTASFVAEDAGFDQLWPAVDQALKSIRFE